MSDLWQGVVCAHCSSPLRTFAKVRFVDNKRSTVCVDLAACAKRRKERDARQQRANERHDVFLDEQERRFK